MTVGDRPGLPLGEEPHLVLRAPLAGTGARAGVQPVDATLALEDEPAVWPPAGAPG